MKLTQANGKLTIEIDQTIKRAKHIRTVEMLASKGRLTDAIQYIQSINGKRAFLSVPRLETHGKDTLAGKQKESIFKAFQSMCNTSRPHIPIDLKTDWFGVEIECFIPWESVATSLPKCRACDGSGSVAIDDDPDSRTEDCARCDGLGYRRDEDTARSAVAALFRSKGIKFSNIKGDGSISCDVSVCFPIEITLLTRFSSDDNLKKACAELGSLKARVNKSCGLHIHLDARHIDGRGVKKIGRQFERALPVLSAMVPRSRRDNQYCGLSVSGLKGSRYHAINLTAFKKYHTIEIRLHSSTTDYGKIRQWAELCRAVSLSEISRVCTTINELTDFVKLPETLVEYITQRTELFSGRPASSVAIEPDSDESEQNTAIVPPQPIEFVTSSGETISIPVGA